jgi:hypothetical protein
LINASITQGVIAYEVTPSTAFTFTIPDNQTTMEIGYTYLNQQHEPTNPPKPPHFTFPTPNIPEPPRGHNQRDHKANFNLSIPRPKIDFPSFNGDEPFNWLRQCEKYFSLATVPIESWVPLTTLHCSGVAQTWWRSLRTPASYVHWAQFCTLVSNRFSAHSAHSSMEHFHHLKQIASVSEYIQKFEELMTLMQMDYPTLNELYYVSSFIVGLKEGIKHYLIPYNPQTLCDVYWNAKELEKGILHKKSLLHPTTPYTKASSTFTLPKPTLQQPPNQPQPTKTIPLKPKEPGK